MVGERQKFCQICSYMHLCADSPEHWLLADALSTKSDPLLLADSICTKISCFCNIFSLRISTLSLLAGDVI